MPPEVGWAVPGPLTSSFAEVGSPFADRWVDAAATGVVMFGLLGVYVAEIVLAPPGVGLNVQVASPMATVTVAQDAEAVATALPVSRKVTTPVVGALPAVKLIVAVTVVVCPPWTGAGAAVVPDGVRLTSATALAAV